MLKNSEEIEILLNAREPRIRDTQRSERGPNEILCDFLKIVMLQVSEYWNWGQVTMSTARQFDNEAL